MEAKEKGILNDLIGGLKCQFVIPVFQRNYNWNIHNCDLLFNDICNLIGTEKKHFIGSFVYKLHKFVDTNYNQYTLIDGQQRMTSIILMLKALYDYLGTLGDEEKKLRDEISESYIYNKFSNEINMRLKLKPNKEDDTNFTLLIDGKFDEIKKESNIYRNYEFLYNKILGMKHSVQDFYNAVQRLEGVSIVLGENDDAQIIFESLNSTGMDLSDVDLIRNYILMNLSPINQERIYENYWIKMERRLKNQFINFFRDYLTMKNRIVTKTDKVYETFKKYYASTNNDLEIFLEELLKYSILYEKIVFPENKNDKLSKALIDFNELNISTTYPFIFGILIENDEGKISDDELEKVIRLIESYVVRRSICNAQGGSLSTLMASFLGTLKDKYKGKLYLDFYNIIASELISISSNAYFPKEELFETAFKTRDIYKSKHKFYILTKLERYLQNKEIIITDNLTIEHIMPLTLSDEWIKYLNRKDYQDFHDKYKNSIGNLTLTAYNSEMSNKLFDEKKNQIDFSRIALNQDLKTINIWNESTINSRADELYCLANKIWDYPVVSPIVESSIIENVLLLDIDSDDYDDYTGTIPNMVKIIEKEQNVKSWAECIIFIIDFLYANNKDIFKELVGASDEPILTNLFNTTKEELRTPYKIDESFYLELNQNTNRKLKIIKVLSELFGLKAEDIMVNIK